MLIFLKLQMCKVSAKPRLPSAYYQRDVYKRQGYIRSFIATVGKKRSYKEVLTYDIYWSWYW